MQLFNTLSRKIEEFKPDKDIVSLYTCGPTVYNYYHVGNLRNAVFNDTLRRTLEASGLKVKHVMNITDVGHLVSDADEGEDKLEKGAAREGKTVWEVAEHYTEAFKADMATLNVMPPNGYQSAKYHDTYARATEFIDQQVEMVKLLLDKGFAYQTQQAIYFDVTKLPDYGKLSGQKLADKEVGARTDVVTDPEKQHPHDFAVWFFVVGHFAEHTMKWASPWGEGFPGWHLECSAIVHSTLGDPIDIHTGGVDHIGTHHPNEMAQTEAAFGHELAKKWLHNEFVLVDGTKMSKSKGNSYTLKDLRNKGFPPLAYRLLVLQAHYRSELNFTWDSLAAAATFLTKLQRLTDRQFQVAAEENDEATSRMDSCQKEILSALQDDLNTPKALSALSELASFIETLPLGKVGVGSLKDFLLWVDSVLGLSLSEGSDITGEQAQAIDARNELRAAKKFAEADEVRNGLLKQGIEIEDKPFGTVWSRLRLTQP